MKIPTYNECLKEYKNGNVNIYKHNGLVSFKYNQNCIYNKQWNNTTLWCRGIVFEESSGKLVATPFKKFFNYFELLGDENKEFVSKLPIDFQPNISEQFVVTEKYDGSLGIVFNYKSKWIVKTSGAFDSEQARWAQNWFDTHVNLSEMNKNDTYCFEIIYNNDRHPISYNIEGMVLLSIIGTHTGVEFPYSYVVDRAKKMNVIVAKQYNFNNIDEILQTIPDKKEDIEGVVITFNNGFKMKVKLKNYIEKHKLFFNLTKWQIWKRYDGKTDMFFVNVDEEHDYKPLSDEKLVIPEELTDLKQFSERLVASINKIFNIVKECKFDDIQDRKEVYESALNICKINNLSINYAGLITEYYIKQYSDNILKNKINSYLKNNIEHI